MCMTNTWDTIGETVEYAGSWWQLHTKTMRSPRGHIGEYQIVQDRSSVLVFGITSDGQVLLAREFFMAQEEYVFTLVAGFVPQGADPAGIARQELLEEAGFEAGTWVDLGKSYQGKYMLGYNHFFLAKDIVRIAEQSLEDEEDIDVMLVSVDEFKRILRRRDIQDVTEVACAYAALDYLSLL